MNDSATPPPKPKFDWVRAMGFTGGRKERLSKHGLPYATFNARMLAVSIDMLLLMLIVAPLCEWLVSWWYGPLAIDFSAISADAAPAEQRRALWEALRANSGIERILTSSGLQIAMFMAFSIACWWKWSATPGKLLLRMRIINAKTGARLSAKQSAGRAIAYLASPMLAVITGITLSGIFARLVPGNSPQAHTLLLLVLAVMFIIGITGYVWIIFDKRRQGFHDKLADTEVVIKPRV